MISDPKNNCRIYGWAVWGNINKKYPAYQMFSTPVQIISQKHCKSAQNGDYCISNDNEDICPPVGLQKQPLGGGFSYSAECAILRKNY